VAQALGTPDPGRLGFRRISTDTRGLEGGELFVALVGERFDAHAFLGDARARGASAAVVRRGTPPVDGLVFFEVADTLAALGALARARRLALPAGSCVVAITGSSGKTSTKEMVRAVLAPRRRVHATSGNLNNLVGVPLTILAAADGTDALVVEAGASEPGEIAQLRRIIEPTIGVVTNVGHAHLEGFGTTERLLEEKAALLDGCPVAVVGAAPALVAQARRRARRVVTVGPDSGADIAPDRVSLDARGRPTIAWRGSTVTLPLFGRQQVANAMMAVAVGVEAGIAPAEALRSLADVRLPPGRGALLEMGGLLVIDDTYNANPDSTLAAIDAARAIAEQQGRPLAVVLGSMLELGAESARLHALVASELMRGAPGPALVAAVGDFGAAFDPHRAALGERLLAAPDVATLGPRLRAALRGNEVVLLKASRGVALERVLPYLHEAGAN
jgi:UDP-N-acetylmuramoyl-tripeptide--D-alanyl-D-alanine ligase